MAEIRRYILVDAQDKEGDVEYEHFEEAYSVARTSNRAVVARLYEYSDSELVWAPDGATVWPPR